MTALAARSVIMADPLEVLVARAEARACLWRSGDIDELHEAVDVLQAAAVQTGLVDQLGQDAVQGIIAAPFATVPRAGEDLVDNLVDIVNEVAPHDGPAANSTIMAAEYLVRKGDRARLRAWLKLHSTQERTAIHNHLEAM